MPQEFHIWSEGGKRCARLIVPAGLDEHGNPAFVEFYCQFVESGMSEEQTENKLISYLHDRASKQATLSPDRKFSRKASKTLSLPIPGFR